MPHLTEAIFFIKIFTMENENSNNSEKKVVNILPLKKGRRILLFLADFFINFIVAFLLFIVAVFPIGKAITGYSYKNANYVKNLNTRGQILQSSGLLFKAPEKDINDVQYHIDFTSDCFLSYYAIDVVNPENVKYTQFGHKLENQVLNTYFIGILGDSDTFCSLFDHYNAKHQYFDRIDDDIILKEEIKEQIRPHFFKKESVSSLGKKYIKSIKNEIYYPMYSEIMSSISENDLVYEGLSYKKVHSEIKNFETYIYNLVQYTSIITSVLTIAIFQLVIPLANRSRKTIGMMILKVERVNIRSLGFLKKKEVVLSFVYQLFFTFIFAFFIPITTLSFAEMFKIQLLFIMGIFSILMLLVNLVFLLIDKFNRSLFDRLLSLVNLSTAELDDVYRAKGYYL